MNRHAYPKYARYKDSGVEWLGKIPEGWEIRKLKTIISRMRRMGWSKEPLLSVYRDHGVIPHGQIEGNHNRPSEDLSAYQLVEPGDLVLNKMKTWQGSLAISPYRGIVSPAYIVCHVATHINGRFLHHLLRSTGYITRLGSLSYGVRVDQWDLRFEDFREIEAVLPPPSEQAAIAAFLDSETAKIDALIEKQERLIERLEEKRKALISHAVTRGLNPNVKIKESGIPWLGKIPEHWETPPLYSRFLIQLGKMLDTKTITGEFSVPYLRNTDVQWDDINTDNLKEMDIDPEERQRFTLRAGDLLVCEGGEVGRAAIWHDQLSICGYQKALHRLRPIRADECTRFMYYLFHMAAHTGIFVSNGNSNTIAHLTGEKLRLYRFPKPPRVEQWNIVELLDAENERIDRILSKVKDLIEGLHKRRASLISAAVTGKIDVMRRT